jgi:hypothetical protein
MKWTGGKGEWWTVLRRMGVVEWGAVVLSVSLEKVGGIDIPSPSGKKVLKPNMSLL